MPRNKTIVEPFAERRVEDPGFLLLNDEPIGSAGEDLLNRSDVANGIAATILASLSAAPLVMAVDAGWGMGKSSLLHQIERELRRHSAVATVQFNAWTTPGDRALEELIKSVLQEIDPNVLRRWSRRVASGSWLVGIGRIVVGAAARVFGVGQPVDDLWRRLSARSGTRDGLRTNIHKLLGEWVARGEGRGIVVFVDDLDRCSDKDVVRVCEVIKLYLDVPGLVFIVSCDQSILARHVSPDAEGREDAGRRYLEKIIQVSYRVPPPDNTELEHLIWGYAYATRIASVIDATVAEILAQRTGRNPRRIKRIFNSFVLEYRLDDRWREAPLGSAALIIAILLQQLYPAFYELVVTDDSGGDVIDRFLDYADVKARYESSPVPAEDDEWWLAYERLLAGVGLSVPEPEVGKGDPRAVALDTVEARLPVEFPDLARTGSFVTLLRGIGDADARRAFQEQLRRRPLATAPSQGDPAAEDRPLAGMRIVRVDDRLGSDGLSGNLEYDGATVVSFASEQESQDMILRTEPDLVLSDVRRGGDPNAGFEQVERLRSEGYTGPVLFYCARIDEDRRHRAAELDAEITNDAAKAKAFVHRLWKDRRR